MAAVAIKPDESNVLYAAGMGGVVYQSNDDGANWQPSERVGN